MMHPGSAISEQSRRMDFVNLGPDWCLFEDGTITEVNPLGSIQEPKDEFERLTRQVQFYKTKVQLQEDEIKRKLEGLRAFVQDHLRAKKFKSALRHKQDVFATLKPEEKALQALRAKLEEAEAALARIRRPETAQERQLREIQKHELEGENEAKALLDEINLKTADLFGDESEKGD